MRDPNAGHGNADREQQVTSDKMDGSGSHRDWVAFVSQMLAPLVACRDPAGKLWQLCKVFYVFEHKTQYLLIHAPFSCLRLRQWPVTYLITLSDWIMSCQPGRHAVVTVCERDWKHKWAAYKSFDETSSFNNL